MNLLKPIRTSPRAPEEIFAEKYDWLLKWAIHFAQGDHAEAEDLVQDTFVRFVASECELKDPERLEPLLYTYLKFVHLSHQRRSQRTSFQELPLFEFDSIELAVRETPAVDSIELQDTLRRIVAFLVWRKERAKSASILLLRFFHGFRKDEIVKIGLLSEPVVANGLRIAREETRHHISGDFDPAGEKASPALPHLFPTSVAVTHERLLQELLRSIFDARQTPCLPRHELLAHYEQKQPKSIRCKLLAHIVSCESCLQIVCERHGIPPLSGRSSEEILAGVRRTKIGLRSKGTGEDGPRRVLRAARQRLLELYDHQPRQLRVAVNGHIIAWRDVSSSHNTMAVEIARETKVEFIELVSEQGVCLLAMPVTAAPPAAPPVLRQMVDLHQGRSAEMTLRFTALGPLLDISYSDPSLSAVGTSLHDGLEDGEADDSSPVLGMADDKPSDATVTPVSELFHWIRPKQSVWHSFMNSLLASALVLGLASVICFVFWMKQRPANLSANTFLVKAEAWDPSIAKARKPGVVRQTVRIKTSRRTFDHTLYRDAQGVRTPKPPALSPGEPRWNNDLAAAHVPLEDPLSAATYQDWHDSQRVRQDEIARTGTHLLTLTTTVPQGEVAQESLTVRDTDFHPVQRTVRFRGSETVEIAELTYDVLPWQPSSEQWFEPLAIGHAVLPTHGMVLPHLPRVLSDMELDEAELSARLVLNQIGADTERIELVRIPAGVQVKGIVATEERKQQIETRLRMVPNVIPAVFTFQELQSGTVPSQPETSVAMSSTVAEVTPLEQGLLAKGLSREQVGGFADRLFDYSASISQASKALDTLSSRFAADRNLSESARSTYVQLSGSYQKQILTTLANEEELVRQTGIQAMPSSSPDALLNLRQAADKNIALCRELVRNGVAQPRPAEAILPELLTSAAQLRAIASRTERELNSPSKTSSLPPPADQEP